MEKIKIGDLIKYNYLFSNESEKYGIVCFVKPDSNFNSIISILTCTLLEVVPYSIMEYEIIQNKK